MTEVKFREQPAILNSMIDGLSQAEGACSQLIHQHTDPRWMMMRTAVEAAKEGCIAVATINARSIKVGAPS